MQKPTLGRRHLPAHHIHITASFHTLGVILAAAVMANGLACCSMENHTQCQDVLISAFPQLTT
jgi:hypothetical protein